MTLDRARSRGKAASAAGSGRMPVPAVSVDEEQRRRLIECCAFFRAQRFREAAPGRYRREDLDSAACAIDTVIKAAGKRKKQ
jgi:hypothetical protein